MSGAEHHFVWDFDPVLIHLGSFQIRYYGVLFAAAIYVGYLVMKWQFKRGGYGEEKADHLFLYTTLGIVIGARLGHVFFYEPGLFLADPIEIFKIWRGGLASHGATIGIFITTWIFVKRHKVPVVEVLDRLAMSVAVGSSFIRLGNFLNSEIVGRISEAPYAIVFKRFDMNPRIPSQLVEVAIGLVVFLALFLVDHRYKEARPRGLLASLYLILYFALRFAVEFIKEEQVDFLARHHSPLTMGQYLSIPFFLGGCVGLYFAVRKWYVPAALAPAAEPDRSYVRRKKKKR
jgi:phosphatidylglycerol:prolipoprotein diacylglycerol transferase